MPSVDKPVLRIRSPRSSENGRICKRLSIFVRTTTFSKSSGYLAWEMVRKLTLCTLLVKSDTERAPASSVAQAGVLHASPSAKTEEKPADVPANGSTLDGSPKPNSPPAQTPILPEHIFEACRRLQFCYQPLRQFHGGPVRSKLSLVSDVVCHCRLLMIE